MSSRSRVCLWLLGSVFAVIAVASHPAPASAGYWHSCYPPDVFIKASLRAHDVHCGKARRVITGFLRKSQEQGPDVTVAGFHCQGVGLTVSCRRGSQRIKLHGVPGRPMARAVPAATSGTECPDASDLERVANPRAAIPAAKAATPGKNERALEATRGPRSSYAAAAKQLCGVEVLRKSLYVRLHPVGIRCASCDIRVFMIKYRSGPWEIWTTF
jgi:hypothetical protein